MSGDNLLTGAQLQQRDQYVDGIEVSRIRGLINEKISLLDADIGNPKENEEERNSARELKRKLEVFRVKLSSP